MVTYGLVLFLCLDFAAYLTHYLQHKIPILWEFHKIHHSAEVLHPLTNYREHPIDNVAYAIANGIATGLVISGCQFLFSAVPTHLLVPMLGISVLPFLFNFMGYNLRHSHIWLRWPGVLAYLWGCPAHHQIHHSYRPKHINKNFAFMFPIWDVVFGTFYLPKHEEKLDIGIGDGTEGDYHSFVSLYATPFVRLFRSAQKSDGGSDDQQPRHGSG